ncbi:hypothetical protein [Sinirhodobacter huangdaonensis]|uniref:NACHT domain-containing protein n=1 Tax=Paenirhodobacter huangdaonensis TaxID=2501515 RepID=A0A3S3N940_9RHOB|nr:hypothetical protein [Sinirhodobacter huangdaonensis]RWR50334.1 hypothetical protein EOW66_15125 [Sinirhodobacter huangdaonensis]
MDKKKTWASFEERVRAIAGYAYGRECRPERIGGINIDGVVKVRPDYWILVEITEERNLEKVRRDVTTKLVPAKHTLMAKGIFAQLVNVLSKEPTEGMKDIGKDNFASVVSVESLAKIFFDHSRYQIARSISAFGSAVNPATGERDTTQFVHVKYYDETNEREVGIEQISNLLKARKNVVLIGEFGSGKSRCVEQVFLELSKNSDELTFPLSIDLRDSWGLKKTREMIRRHFSDLGLPEMEGDAIKAYNAKAFIVLMDGFDELGSQAWTSDPKKLSEMRHEAMSGVREAVRDSAGGVLVAGREHYFASKAEMFSALGMNPKEAIIIRSRPEFSESEVAEYFQNIEVDVDLPRWLPRRPLICQTISSLDEAVRDEMFSSSSDQLDFWKYFIDQLCMRDARIHISFSPETIYGVYLKLARASRAKPGNVGPVTLDDLEAAFEAVVGSKPSEQAAVMLQRLPSLGRVDNDSPDVQFVDMYILDGFRAVDLSRSLASTNEERIAMASEAWQNSLRELGQRLLARDASVTSGNLITYIRENRGSSNKVLLSDLISALCRREAGDSDFGGVEMKDLVFDEISFTETDVKGLSMVDCMFGNVMLPPTKDSSIKVVNGYADRVFGISSANALPDGISLLEGARFEEVVNVSKIREIGLTPPQEIFITIVKKTFFQKGSGRKEEALVRGLGRLPGRKVYDKVLNIMLRESILTRFKGDDGWVYSPNRSEMAGRMSAILDELSSSEDPLWQEISDL